MNLTVYASPVDKLGDGMEECTSFAAGSHRTNKKIILAMKLTIFCLFLLCLQVSATGFGQHVSIKGKGLGIDYILSEIQKQTGYEYFMTGKQLKSARKVDLDFTDADVINVLDATFRNQPFTYSLEGKIISIITPTGSLNPGLSPEGPVSQFLPPPITVRGRIVNENGEPVVASIVVKGSNNGTTSDANGDFVLNNIDANASLIFSGISIETQEIILNGRSGIIVKAITKIGAEQEVVISGGYYKTTNRTKTGSIVRIDAKELTRQPVTNPLMALQGRVAGLEVTPTSGVPGAAPSVQIRGLNSVRTRTTVGTEADGNRPLIVIDGIPVSAAPITSSSGTLTREGFDPLSGLSIESIESIEVLKDADATAIFGSRGANGVILITTKNRSASQKLTLDAQIYRGVGQVVQKMKMLNARQYLQMRHEAIANDGQSALDQLNDPLFGPLFFPDLLLWDTIGSTDLQDVLFNKSSITHAQTTLSAGNGQTSFNFSTGYHRETLIYPGDFGSNQYSMDLSVMHRSKDQKLIIRMLGKYALNDNHYFQSAGFDFVAYTAPTIPNLYNPDGSLNWAKGPFAASFENPLAMQRTSQDSKMNTFLTTLSIGYQLAKNVRLSSNFGYNQVQFNELIKVPLSSQDPHVTWLESSRLERKNNRSYYSIEPQVEYNQILGGHTISAIVGGSLQDSRSDKYYAGGFGFSSDALLGSMAGAARSITNNNNSQYRFASLFSRIGYEYNGKYLLNLTARRDGSSRFGQNNRFGNFGAVGAAWIFTKEKGMEQNLKWLSYGKIRGSYGVTGNDQIGDGAYLKRYQIGYYRYNNNVALVPTALLNANYQWETTRKLELALETSFFNNRISFEAAWYRHRSSNQLVQYRLPATAGMSDILDNFPAVVENKGWEFNLRTVNVRHRDFEWKTSFNISTSVNKLKAYPGIETSSYNDFYKVGESLTIQPTYIWTGVDRQTGVHTFEDLNRDGFIGSEDIVFTKSLDTRYFGGFGNDFRYKRFSLNLFFHFRNYNALVGYDNTPGRLGNQPVEVLGRWQKPGDITDVAKFTMDYAAIENYNSSDAAIRDIVFARLRTLNLSYAFPETFTRKISASVATVFLQAQNLFSISNFNGWDPETLYSAPAPRIISIGLQLKL